MTDPIWHNTVDNGAWHVQVVRVNGYRGRLEIYRMPDHELVHSQDVGLSYGAMFGPDIEDVELWKAEALIVIDSLEGSADAQA